MNTRKEEQEQITKTWVYPTDEKWRKENKEADSHLAYFDEIAVRPTRVRGSNYNVVDTRANVNRRTGKKTLIVFIEIPTLEEMNKSYKETTLFKAKLEGIHETAQRMQDKK